MEVLQDIPYELDTESLCAKLHLQKGSDDAKELDALVESIRPHIKPKAVYIESYIEARGEDTVTIDRVTFTSRVLRANLESVERVFPFITTCGREIDESRFRRCRHMADRTAKKLVLAVRQCIRTDRC